MSEDTGIVTDRILTLDSVRRPTGRKHDFVTIATAEEMVRSAILAERVEYEAMVKWYMMQIPELVAKMIGDALTANGLTFKGPSELPAPEATTPGQSGEAAVPVSPADATIQRFMDE